MEHLAPAFSAGGSPLQNLVQSNQCLQRGSTACRVRAAFFRSLIQRSGPTHNKRLGGEPPRTTCHEPDGALHPAFNPCHNHGGLDGGG